ncbi:MAG: S8 family serine peptidase [Roseiflexaceae bacterium]
MRSIRRSGRLITLFLVILTVLAGSASALAKAPQQQQFTATALTPESQYSAAITKDIGHRPQAAARAVGSNTKLVSVIVKLQAASLANYAGDVPGLAATSPQATGAAKVDPQSPQSKQYLAYVDAQQNAFASAAQAAIPSAKITHKLNIIVGGVSMLVPEDQVAALSSLPGVVAVYPDQLLHLDTDRTPEFIGATTAWAQLGGQESAGEHVIVGVLDSGVWPEHPSFSDPDPSGKAYSAPPPPAPGDTRACEFSGGAHPGPAFACNNKLIGADRFMDTYESAIGLEPGEFTTARDDDGHGTHTATTSAGNANVAASIFGVSRGTISGIAPRAHVMAYKVCGDAGCFGSDSAAAIQKAILDGVNVINFSISGGGNPYADAVELAFLDAYNAGVFVAASAGNSGPGADTTAHRGPWVTTVAASTADRAFKNTITLSGGGSSLSIKGTSLTLGVGPAPVVVPADIFCAGPYAAGTFTGKIVVCQRGGPLVQGRVQKGYNILQGGAVGMILFNTNTATTDQETDNHFLPTTHIQYSEGQQVLAFLAAHPGTTGTLTAGAKDTQKGDVMASFSSRGGPGQTLGISKPDITAPGVQILAGHTPQSVSIATGPQGELFQAIAGTSMSSPHIAGSGALIKALHPTWTPGQIKSALMTTAVTKVVKEDGSTPADAFDYGSGRVNLKVAGDPGLTFDVSAADYVTHQDDLWSVNYPSVYIPVMPGAATVNRTAHSVLTKESKWKLKVKSPSDVKISVPDKLKVPAGGNASFAIAIDARDVPIGEVRFATLTLTQDGDGKRELHMPITIFRQQPVITVAKTCAPAVFPKKATTTCSTTITNTTFEDAQVSLYDKLPDQLNLINSSVVGGTQDHNRVLFSGTLAGAQAPVVSIAPGTSPAGYLPLSAFGIAPIGGVGDETITNFNVPAFNYGGQNYARIGLTSNGYAIVGGGTDADVAFINQIFPDPTPPNNVLAPYWTDLNPGAAGALRVGTLTDGVNTWLVLDWEGVREYSTANSNSFQIWIGVDGAEDITFTYGAVGGIGDGGSLTVGAENFVGTSGENYYANGVGTLPNSTTELRVSSVPGVPGGTHVVTYVAEGKKTGKWVNYSEVTSDQFFGTNIARFAGEVKK